MIVDLRDDDHAQKADQCGKSLLFHIIQGIMEFYPAIVGAGAVKHHKSDCHKDQDHRCQRLIIPPLPFGTLQ